MKFTRLRLHNIRSYRDETIELPAGTTLIHGRNGAGKTSLLMGLFGGLYLSGIRHVGSRNFKLEDFIHYEAKKGEIELEFEHEDTSYTIEWRLFRSEASSEAVLRAKILDEPISGVRNVRQFVSDLLGLKERDFASSVYIQQGEVDRLLDSDTRASLLDNLLGIEQLAESEDRVREARQGVGHVVRSNAAQAKSRHDEINDEFERSETDFEKEINDISEQIESTEKQLTDTEETLEELRADRAEVMSELEAREQQLDRIDAVEDRISDTQKRRKKYREEIENLESEIDDELNEISSLGERIPKKVLKQSIDFTDREEVESAREELDKRLEAKHEELTEKQSRQRELETQREQLQENEESIKEERTKIDQEIQTTEEELSDQRTQLQIAREDLESIQQRQNQLIKEFWQGAQRWRSDLPEDLITRRNDIEEGSLRRWWTKIENHEEQNIDSQGVLEDYDTISNPSELIDEFKIIERTLQAAEELLVEREVQQENTEAQRESAREVVEELTDDIGQLESEIESIAEDLSDAREDVANVESQLEQQLDEIRNLSDTLGIGVKISGSNIHRLQGAITEQRNEHAEQLTETASEIGRLSQRCNELKGKLSELRELGEHEQCPRCGQAADGIHIKQESSDIKEKLRGVKEKLETAQKRQSRLQARTETLSNLEETLEQALEIQIARLPSTEKTIERLEQKQRNLKEQLTLKQSSLNERNEELSQLEKTPEQIAEEIEEIQAFRDTLRDQREVAEELVDIVDHKTRLSKDIKSQVSAIDNLEQELNDLRAEREELSTELSRLGKKKESIKERIVELTTAVEELEGQQTEVENVFEILDRLVDRLADVEKRQQRRMELDERIAELEEQIKDLKEEKSSLSTDVDLEVIDKTDKRIMQLEQRIEEHQTKRQELRQERDNLNEQFVRLEEQLESLRATKQRAELYERRAIWAQAVYDELTEVIESYQSARTELRETHLAYVIEYTNEIFQNVYKNSNYQQVLISDKTGDYEIQLLRSDGTLEKPSNASGGERAIVNLALRAGIYRLIAELSGWDQSQLPPLMLDEPTTFLDRGHVERLEDLLESIQDWNVPQILIVSTDENLIHGAEYECEVWFDVESGTSKVNLRPPVD